MGRRKKLLTEVLITGIADKGKSVGRTAEGQVVFVENVAPGDVVDILVLRKRKGFMEGIVKHFHEYSTDRVDAPCQHFGVCGGCRWQHVSYESQLKNKSEVVQNAIQRIAKLPTDKLLPILPAVDTIYYRNKLEFTFSNKRWLTKEELDSGISKEQDVLGFHRPRAFDKIVDIQECLLEKDPSNEIRNYVRATAQKMGMSFFDLREQHGIMRNMVIRITSIDQIMLIFSFFENDMDSIRPFLDDIGKQFPQVTSLYYCINAKKNDSLIDVDMIHYKGEKVIEEVLGEVRFRIGPKSFFQTNSKQAVRLFDVVADFAGLTGVENVYDLYTGIGSIALYLADKCKQVVGIEEVPPAIEDAIQNAELNNIENAIFYAGDVKNVLSPDFAKKHGKPDVVITDPPRAGMHADVVKFLLNLAAPKMVYVSCNPATQARDLNLLAEKYDVIKIQPVDMFPHTHHIESVALLELK